MQNIELLHSAFHPVNDRPNSSFNPTKKRLPFTPLRGAWPTAVSQGNQLPNAEAGFPDEMFHFLGGYQLIGNRALTSRQQAFVHLRHFNCLSDNME